MSRRAPLAPHLGLHCAILAIFASVAAFSPTVHGAAHVADDLQKIASNGQAMVAVGNDVLYRSTDSGKTWEAQKLERRAALIDVAACADESFVALDFHRHVWTGEAQGTGWRRAEGSMPEDFTPMALACAPDGGFWVVGTYSTVLHSSDRGASWQKTEFGEDAILNTIRFLDADHAVVAGEFGIVARSSDGGASWQMLPPIPDDFYAFDAWFTDTDTGWLTGRGGIILGTRDGGQSWTSETNAAGVPMYGFVPGAGGRLFAVGELGLVQQRGSNGEWRVLPSATSGGGYLRGGIALPGGSSLIVVGGSGASTPAMVSIESEGIH
ncbi:WD40/YVTN/BNR-like repeat-containing protein [Sinimarinibacterium flocculans]|uniref:Photosystem II stability/assembly factor-like uncharacterized protein n=1 Tax=Sinimarinibacterium flocculans TaxID=985250 RepID=A0A318E1E6_9GAMM|nr:YCF48-related protein [Sinimarinibacterium flocculans]PXV63452.1 photosystem II stability/assembly factor-like uncharacterized protein [Sinimarinibacterium flocculans]